MLSVQWKKSPQSKCPIDFLQICEFWTHNMHTGHKWIVNAYFMQELVLSRIPTQLFSLVNTLCMSLPRLLTPFGVGSALHSYAPLAKVKNFKEALLSHSIGHEKLRSAKNIHFFLFGCIFRYFSFFLKIL